MMFTAHYLHPERLWAVFDTRGACVALFASSAEADEYCERHNEAR